MSLTPVLYWFACVWLQAVLQDNTGNTVLVSVCVGTGALAIVRPVSASARLAGLELPAS